jgi:hypothetical protein
VQGPGVAGPIRRTATSAAGGIGAQRVDAVMTLQGSCIVGLR